MGGYSSTDDKLWDELTFEQQQAASIFGYDRYSWDGVDPVTGAIIMSGMDDYVSYDDDYVFRVKIGKNSINGMDVYSHVSRYQILYFFAATCFVLVGIFDLIIERHAFHVLMILAGVFGVVSSVYVEDNLRLSNICNCVSVHFFLLEAVTLFGEHKKYRRVGVGVGGAEDEEEEEEERWMKNCGTLGDLEFVLGSLIDVVVSVYSTTALPVCVFLLCTKNNETDCYSLFS